MPITKRRNLPQPPARRIPKSEQYRIPGTPLETLVKDYDRKASDAEWGGNIEEANRLQSIANEYRKRIADGELYEVDH